MKEVFSAMFHDEALVVKSLLESAGLNPQLFEDSIPNAVPLYPTSVFGIRVCVPDDEMEDAESIVADFRSRKKDGTSPDPQGRPQG